MPADRLRVGPCFRRTFPPAFVIEVARELDRRGVDQLWTIEDCFFTTGVSLAASALSVTERLTVGIGILPAVIRTAALTAMELATLSGLGPGRLLPGIGHGAQRWMAQMGVKPVSPLTALEETMTSVRRLLAGELVTTRGHYVHLDAVQLDQPPADPLPLLAGVSGPKSMALAGRVADGVVLVEPTSPAYVGWALEQAGRTAADFHVAAFGVLRVEKAPADAYRAVAPWLAAQLDKPKPTTAFTTLPFYDDLRARYANKGIDGLVTMPREWWRQLGPVGDLDDAVAHVQALEAAGVRSLGLYPADDVATARAQIDDFVALTNR